MCMQMACRRYGFPISYKFQFVFERRFGDLWFDRHKLFRRIDDVQPTNGQQFDGLWMAIDKRLVGVFACILPGVITSVHLSVGIWYSFRFLTVARRNISISFVTLNNKSRLRGFVLIDFNWLLAIKVEFKNWKAERQNGSRLHRMREKKTGKNKFHNAV